MRNKMIITLASLSILSGCVAGGTSTPTQTSSAPTVTRAATTPFTSLLNDFRASQGRGQVVPSVTLNRAAQRHADDMVRRGYFSHDSPGGPNGDTFIARSRAAGCQSRAGAENIADGQRNEAEVIEAWKNSSGHRRNMLVGSYTQYGLGRSGNVWVLVFSGGC